MFGSVSLIDYSCYAYILTTQDMRRRTTWYVWFINVQRIACMTQVHTRVYVIPLGSENRVHERRRYENF